MRQPIETPPGPVPMCDGLNASELDVLRGIELMRPYSTNFGHKQPLVRTQAGSHQGKPILGSRSDRPKGTTLVARRSSRELINPIDLPTLLALIDLIHDGRRFRTPSTGGINELSLLMVANDVHSLPVGAYVLEPWQATIAAQRYSPALMHTVNAEFCTRLGLDPETPPALCALIFADVTALARHYTHGALAAATLDCGMLMYALQLAATEVGLRSCMVGCAMNDQLAPHLPVDTEAVPNLGGVAIGG